LFLRFPFKASNLLEGGILRSLRSTAASSISNFRQAIEYKDGSNFFLAFLELMPSKMSLVAYLQMIESQFCPLYYHYSI
jgi:hypothetical protein